VNAAGASDGRGDPGCLEWRVVGDRADAWPIGGADVGDCHGDQVWNQGQDRCRADDERAAEAAVAALAIYGSAGLRAGRCPGAPIRPVCGQRLIHRPSHRLVVTTRTRCSEVQPKPQHQSKCDCTNDKAMPTMGHGQVSIAHRGRPSHAAALEREVPGNVLSYSRPIELRVQEPIAGVRSDLAITLFGEDLNELRRVGADIVRVLRGAGRGRRQAGADSGLPFLRMKIRRDEIARYGISASQVLDVVQTMGGRTVGEVLEGQRRFDIQVRFTPESRTDVERIRSLKVADPQGRMIPLSQLADIVVEEGPAQITRENIHRRIAVEANVRGTDRASFVADVQQAVSAQVTLPTGYYVEYGGQFENLQRASSRLVVVVPVALFLIFLLLYTTFGAVRPALLIYFNIPIAATGGTSCERRMACSNSRSPSAASVRPLRSSNRTSRSPSR
jgi:hypothetical protein